MSLSWIKNITRTEIHMQRTLGITFGRSEFKAVLISQSKKETRVDWHKTIKLETLFFKGQPNTTHGDVLKSFLGKVSSLIQDKFVRVQVFLPDAMALYGFYKVDSVPDTPAQCRQLACWRIGKQFHVQDRSWRCDYQIVGEQGQKTLMMAMAMEETWLTFIQDILYESGILAPIIDTRINHYFNQLDISIKQDSGAVIDLTEDYWTVMAWDNKGQPRFVRSCWRSKESIDHGDELIGMAQDIIESLLVYCNEATDTQISGIYILGAGHTERAMGEILNTHMTQVVKYFDLPLERGVDNENAVTTQTQIQSYAAAIPR